MRCPHMIPNNNNPNFDLYLPTNQIICVHCIKKHPEKVPLKRFDYFAASGEPFVKCPNMTIATSQYHVGTSCPDIKELKGMV